MMLQLYDLNLGSRKAHNVNRSAPDFSILDQSGMMPVTVIRVIDKSFFCRAMGSSRLDLSSYHIKFNRRNEMEPNKK